MLLFASKLTFANWNDDRDGVVDNCSETSRQKLKDFLEKYEGSYLKVAPLETPSVRDALTCGMYISHPHLQVDRTTSLG